MSAQAATFSTYIYSHYVRIVSRLYVCVVCVGVGVAVVRRRERYRGGRGNYLRLLSSRSRRRASASDVCDRAVYVFCCCLVRAVVSADSGVDSDETVHAHAQCENGPAASLLPPIPSDPRKIDKRARLAARAPKG